MQSVVDQNVIMRCMTLFNMTGNVRITLGHIQCGFVALDIQHAKCMRHTANCGPLFFRIISLTT